MQVTLMIRQSVYPLYPQAHPSSPCTVSIPVAIAVLSLLEAVQRYAPWFSSCTSLIVSVEDVWNRLPTMTPETVEML